MKLEVGQFVRLKSGYICKIININDFREPNMKYGVEANYLKDVMFIGDDDVVKASYNIIDILEVGDYVNGSKVIEIEKDYKFIDNEIRDILWLDNKRNNAVWKETIKSIVTKEQFSSMAYKLGDNK